MEQNNSLESILLSYNITLPSSSIEKLNRYALVLFEESKLYNLTGLKTIESVYEILIAKSLLPFKSFDVLRGTSVVDIGTGSGIPGLVLGITCPETQFTLIDSNTKKTAFIASVIDSLGLTNITVVSGRIEEIGHDSAFREAFDVCVTRAFGPLYYSLEFGVPVIKESGLLYVYSAIDYFSVLPELHAHAHTLGGEFCPTSLHQTYGLDETGLLFKKTSRTPAGYPRRFAVVKRESQKYSD